MEQQEKRLKEIVGWLEGVKGVELNNQDRAHFQSVIMLATNDGYREAIGVTGTNETEIEIGRK